MKKLTNKNRLSVVNPELSKEWDYDKNGELTPEDVSYGSHKKAWWKCKKGHSWETKINDRNHYRTGCPYCSGHKVNKENCLATVNPNLAKEWDYKKNVGITPNDFTGGSNKEVWWICKKKHSWVNQINDRNNGNGCPYCTHIWVSKENCLATVNPKLAKEWDYTKNGKSSPKNVAANSSKKAWWKCKKGHEYLSRIASRNIGDGCPYCSGHRVSKENCLDTLSPKLSKDWHPSKNGAMSPQNVTAFSKRKVWWICHKGHEWEAEVCNRSKNGTGCPYCNKVLLKDGTSFDSIPEAYFYLKHIKSKYKRVEFHKKYGLGDCKCDFYLPQINTYIEVTSYNNNCKGWAKDIWKNYIKRIAQKEKYVEDVLMAKFRFVQMKLTKKQILYVRKNSV